MSRISSCLVVLNLILFSRGTIRVYTEESQISTSADETSSSSPTDSQNIPPADGIEVSTNHLTDAQMLPQEPYPEIVDDLRDDNEANLVPPTPTVDDDFHVLSIIAGGAAAAEATLLDIKDTSSIDSTAQSVDYTADTSVTEAVSKTDVSHSDIEKTRDGGESSPNVIESSQLSVDGETRTSTEPDKMFSEVKDAESATGMNRPDISQILNEIQHTQIYDDNQISHQHPSSEGGSYTFDVPVATEALKSVDPGTWDVLSNLPVGVDKMAVDPVFVDDAVVPTQFSLKDADEKKKTEEEEFPTFDKWSMQYLAEQEKQKSEKKQEQAVNPSTLLLQKKLRQNFALASCGAKIIANNPEAENAKYLLNRNPDEYMISPCKAKKWFVVELCEPIQIHKVELGSLEMFSSQPKSFRVSASQRYPTKEWIPLGKFDVIPERTIQSFTTPPNEDFVKFVRVELLEHYGDEHYCPITTFRVLGVDMSSDDEYENDHAVEETDEEPAYGEFGDDEVEESVNIFTSAKEIMIKLVKKVLSKGYDEKEELETIDNTTAKAEEKKADVVPCSEKSKVSIISDVPTVHVPEAGVVPSPPASRQSEEVPIVTKLADTEQLPMVQVETPVVIKLDKDADGGSWDFSMHDTSDLCFRSPWSSYVQMMAYARLRSSICPVRPVSSVKQEQLPSFEADKGASVTGVTDQGPSLKPEYSEINEIQHEQMPDETRLPSQDEGDRSVSGRKDMEPKSLSETEMDKSSASSSPRLPMQNGVKVISTTGQQLKHSEESIATSQSVSFTSSGVSVTKSQALEPSSLFSQAEVEDVTLSLTTPGLDIQQSQVVEHGATSPVEKIFLKVSPSPTLTSEDSLEVGEEMQLEAPTAEQQADFKADEYISQQSLDADSMQDSEGQGEGQGSQTVSDQAKLQTVDKNGTSSGASKTAEPVDLVKVGLSSSSKRDISIMKLNTRIMALEQNVSMTKKYLEELSRAFKQQNEDMMKLLNKTETKLNVYIAQSEDRELRQQTHIDVLELKVANLSQVLDTVHLQMNALGKELRDAQFLLAFFQAVLFLWLMITSFRGRSKTPLVYTDHQFLLDTMPSKPTFERAEKGNLHRRNSDIGVQSGLEPGILKRQVSEANLACFGGHKQHRSIDNNSTFPRDPSQMSKKRKKKKLKRPQLSLDSESSVSATSNSGGVPAQSSSFSCHAGVLFGTDSYYRPKESLNVGDLSSEIASKKNYNVKYDDSLHQGHCHLGCSYDIPRSLVAASKPGMVGLRPDANCQNVSNSAAVIASKFHDGVSSFIPGRIPDINRIQSSQYSRHQSISELAFSESTHTARTINSVSPQTSPEFQLPLYHRNKIRRLVENTTCDHQGSTSCQNITTSTLEQFRRRGSVGFINPDIGGEFFLAENYMYENRFKFPSNSISHMTQEPDTSLWKSTGSQAVVAGVTPNGSVVDDKYPPRLSCPLIQFQPPHSSTLSKGPPLCKSTSSLSTLSSSSGISSSKSVCQTPSFIPLHQSATQASFISVQHIPHSVSQLSSKSLAGASAEQGDTKKPSPQPVCLLATQTLESGPIISSGYKSCLSTPQFDIRQSSQTKSNTSETARGVSHNKPPNVHQMHRRQGSLPLHQLRPSKSFEKESQPCSRKGSFEDSKQFRKYSSGSLEGSKMKRPSSLSGFNKKSLGSNVSTSDSSVHLTSNKKSHGSNVSTSDSSVNLTSNKKGTT